MMETRIAKQTLQDYEARHKNILKLERCTKELYDMFMDMAIVVETQVVSLSISKTLFTASKMWNKSRKPKAKRPSGVFSDDIRLIISFFIQC